MYYNSGRANFAVVNAGDDEGQRQRDQLLHQAQMRADLVAAAAADTEQNSRTVNRESLDPRSSCCRRSYLIYGIVAGVAIAFAIIFGVVFSRRSSSVPPSATTFIPPDDILPSILSTAPSQTPSGAGTTEAAPLLPSQTTQPTTAAPSEISLTTSQPSLLITSSASSLPLPSPEPSVTGSQAPSASWRPSMSPSSVPSIAPVLPLETSPPLLVTALSDSFPSLPQGSSLVASGVEFTGYSEADNLGNLLAWSGDNALAVGAPNGQYVRIFVHNSNNDYTIWQQLGSDLIGESAAERFASSLAISDDGSTVAVGAPGAGLVRVFQYTPSDGTWEQLGSDLENTEPSDDAFGISIALAAASGIWIAVAAQSGYVRTYQYSSVLNDWKVLGGQDKIIVGETVHGVQFSSDGTILAIATDRFVKVYGFLIESWLEIGSSIAGDDNGGVAFEFALSKSGKVVAMASSTTESVSVYTFLSNQWVPLGSEVEVTGVGSVVLNGAGNVLGVVGSGPTTGGAVVRNVVLYGYKQSDWKILAELEGDSISFGTALASSPNSTMWAVGAANTVRIYQLL